MTPLNFNKSLGIAPRNRKKLKLILGIGALAGVVALGSTLAANINLNTGHPVEFGQGIAATTACDSNIVITPFSSFANAEGGGAFKLGTIRVSDIDLAACAGNDFVIKAYGTSQSALNFFQSTSSIVIADDGTVFSVDPTSGILISTSDSTSFTLLLDSADPTTLSATDVYRFTIESRVHVDLHGPIGPGGGTIFYHSTLAFTEAGSACNTNCHYLEWAPSNWYGTLEDPALIWSNTSTQKELTDYGLGYGFTNTALMHTLDSPAADAVLLFGGTDSSVGDWFIPSADEFTLMANSAFAATGGFKIGATYHTSSDTGAENLYMGRFPEGLFGSDWKTYSGRIRPIRAF